MKKLLNVLYVTTEGAGLRKDGDNVVVEIDGAERFRAPLHMLSSIVVFGAIYLSPALIQICAGRNISIALLERNGRFQARIEGPTSGNVLLRRAQYKLSEQPEPVVKSMLIGKIANQRAVLQRAIRDYGREMPDDVAGRISAATGRMAQIIRNVEVSTERLDILRGAEGEAAQIYFSVFNHLIRSDDPKMAFTGRNRRPPLDPVNALMSFLYTLLTHDCRSAIESVGLDPAVGFLHRERPGRPSLALDLMEEMRPAIADRLVLSLVNRRQITGSDFDYLDSGAVTLKDDARKTVLTAWQDRKKDERRHDFLGENAPLGLTPFIQAQLLARHIRGDLDGYPPWFWK